MRRFVAELRRRRVTAESSLPGGQSADPASPFYVNLLEPWLLNETHPLLIREADIAADAVSQEEFVPAP